MELVEHPGVLPVPQAPPAGHPGSESQLLRQVFPADSGEQHEEDALQHLSVRQRFRTRPTRRPYRQQELDPSPQLVGDVPRRSHQPRSSEVEIINVLGALRVKFNRARMLSAKKTF